MTNIEECEANVKSANNGTKCSFGFNIDVYNTFFLKQKNLKSIINYLLTVSTSVGLNSFVLSNNKTIENSYIYRDEILVECSKSPECLLSAKSKLSEINYIEETESISHQSSVETKIASESKIEVDSLKTSVIPDTPKLAVIQFAEDDVYSEGTAAICHSSNLIGKRVMLGNPTNLENDTVVTLSESMDCSLIEKPQDCEGDLIIHIRFSEARKLYSDSYSPEKNIDKLPSCSYANVTPLD